MENFCPKVEKCPIFVKNVLTVQNAAVAYKNLYCTASEEKYSTCKRFLVSNKIGFCPDNVMPNCSKTVDEIVECAKKSNC